MSGKFSRRWVLVCAFLDVSCKVKPCEPTDVCPAENIVSDTSRVGYACRADFTFDPFCSRAMGLKGVRVIGSTVSPGEDPVTIEVHTTVECGGNDTLTTYTSGDEWIAEASDHGFCDVGEDSAAFNCDNQSAGMGTWSVYLPAHSSTDCEDYGDLRMDFLELDGPDCNGGAATTTWACTPAQDVEIDLFHWAVRDLGGNSNLHSRLIPVVSEGGDYVERAWLRSIEVTDWGDASELFIVPFGEYLRLINGDTVDTTDAIVLDTLDDTETFANGEVHMGATFVLDSLPADTDFEAPHITVDWSCAYDEEDPHFQVVTAPQAYASRLSDLGITGLTQDHRVILRNWPGPDWITVELQGRHYQRLIVPVTQVGSVLYFDYESTAGGDVTLKGEATKVGDDVVVTFDDIIFGPYDLGTPTLTFEEFEE